MPRQTVGVVRRVVAAIEVCTGRWGQSIGVNMHTLSFVARLIGSVRAVLLAWMRASREVRELLQLTRRVLLLELSARSDSFERSI